MLIIYGQTPQSRIIHTYTLDATPKYQASNCYCSHVAGLAEWLSQLLAIANYYYYTLAHAHTAAAESREEVCLCPRAPRRRSHEAVAVSESEPKDPIAPRRRRERALGPGAVAGGRGGGERQRRLVRERRGQLRAHRGRRQVQGRVVRAARHAGVRAVALRRQVAPGRGASHVVVRVGALPAAGEPHGHVAEEAAPPGVPRGRAPSGPAGGRRRWRLLRRRGRGRRRRRHHVRLPAEAAPRGEHGGRGRGAAAGPGGARGETAGPGDAGRRDDTGVRPRRRARAGAAPGRAPRAAPRARVPQGGRRQQGRRRRRPRRRRRRGGRPRGQARGRVPGRGRAGGRPAPRRVRGARARRARPRAPRRRRAVPRRRHLPQGAHTLPPSALHPFPTVRGSSSLVLDRTPWLVAQRARVRARPFLLAEKATPTNNVLRVRAKSFLDAGWNASALQSATAISCSRILVKSYESVGLGFARRRLFVQGEKAGAAKSVLLNR
jgi:hypothetical protein